ncbi:conserved Plasmodium protein, unknown function [Plasmodium malariae]|uniref:Uncharacterized protein n=1 Tax=Plasmodium malariae TaxID=5858 RepID=A0A1C3L0D8_PLAMA|nr:conserved Plasmodium protein, unknown function [Plasmodium malariae]
MLHNTYYIYFSFLFTKSAKGGTVGGSITPDVRLTSRKRGIVNLHLFTYRLFSYLTV